MGAIYRFDLDLIKQKFNIENYVETGTGEGMCLKHAMQTPFKRYISCEIYPQVFEKVKDKFPGAELIQDSSKHMLEDILPTLTGNTIFFLDAHFPGADFHFESYHNNPRSDESLPLEIELNLIKQYRTGFNDVIIIDDLRIYKDGPYEGGNWEYRRDVGRDDDAFIHSILKDMNKEIYVDYRDQGYVIGLPK